MEKLNSIDGLTVYNMLRYGFTSLSYNENYLNNINTFPVSDNDTGTNMKRTFQKGLLAINENKNAGSVLHSFAKNMSLGSRGNSGFIFSQYFLGLSDFLKEKALITIEDFSKAIIYAYKIAYAAVINPMEGTMLTAMSEGANEVLNNIKNFNEVSFDDFFNLFSKSIFSSVLKTKSQMELLNTNNVVDSGALGFYLVINGMRKSFDDNIPYFNCEESNLLPKRYSDIDNPMTYFRYCTEFTVNLNNKNTKKYFSNILKEKGDSVVVAINNNLLKVHIHTNIPYNIINDFKSYGTIIRTKVDDLFETPQFERLKRRKHDDYVVIAFTYGEANASLCERLGADVAFSIPFNHKTSEDELKSLLTYYKETNVIVFSADKNVENALKSMHWWGDFKNLFVVECAGMANTFFKLASSMFDLSFDEFKKEANNLKRINNLEFKIDDNKNLKEELNCYLSSNRLKGYSTIAIFGGKNVKKEDIDIVTSFFEENEDIEFNYFPGGQEDSLFIIGAM